MNDVFVFAAHNTLAAILFAVFVYGLTRVWRSPPVAHVLWLLVLFRLVAPPVVQIDWTSLGPPGPAQTVGRFAEDDVQIARTTTDEISAVVPSAARTTAQRPAAGVEESDVVAGVRRIWIRCRTVLLGLWIGGAALCALVIARRVVRFERLLRGTLPAPERLQRLTRDVAGQLGLRRVPDVRYADCIDVPLVWCAGRSPTIVAPLRLFKQLDDQQAAMILAHELAHLRRRDHWVRAFEMAVSIIYWWNPLVWVIRRQMHHAEELCCDAWVRCTFAGCSQRYTELLLQAAESLNAPQVGARLLPASPFLRSRSLKARIEMILNSRFAPCVSNRSIFAIALVALLVLPSIVPTTSPQVQAGSEDQPATKPAVEQVTPPPPESSGPDTAATSELPYAVSFEQGATHFMDGDSITILEVRGTAKDFTPGNIYWIRGRYSLASHDSAMLSAYTTASNAADGTSRSYAVQTTDVDKGRGTFALYLPMSCEGWPHVSFYAGGQSIGGNYFGTGDSVLKRWWGSKDKE